MIGLLWAESGGAQSGRPWVDPPGQTETPPAEAPAPAPPPAAPPAAVQPPVAQPAQPRRIDPPPSRDGRAGAPPDAAETSPSPRPPSEAAQPRPAETGPTERSSPPARAAEPPRAPSAAEAPPSGERRSRRSDHAGAAEEFAVAYLAYWSAPNAVALDATPDFYASQILFHGRQMSARALFEEKRRFVRRWPVREYRPRLETMRTNCDPAPPICTVRTMFDFTASSPQTGKRSQGSALLQLGVSFSSGEPTIVFESSQVTSRAPSARSEAFEDAEFD
jgi:hypothetical protein